MLGPADILEELNLHDITIEIVGTGETAMLRMRWQTGFGPSAYVRDSLLVNKEGVVRLLSSAWEPNGEDPLGDKIEDWLRAGCPRDWHLWEV